MNYLKHLNQENIDAYNKANPEMPFTYEECAGGLEQCVDDAAASIIQNAVADYQSGEETLGYEYINEVSEAVDWTNAISPKDFTQLVLNKISLTTNQENN